MCSPESILLLKTIVESLELMVDHKQWPDPETLCWIPEDMRSIAAKTAKLHVLQPDDKLHGSVGALALSGELQIGAVEVGAGTLLHTLVHHGVRRAAVRMPSGPQ